jgi:hypothetical protein
MTERLHCSAKNKRGEPCKSVMVRRDTGRCQIHSLTPEQRKAQSARGGRTKGTNRLRQLPCQFDEIAWVIELVVATFNGTHSTRKLADYLAPLIARTPGERHELERVLAKITPPPVEPDDDALAPAREYLAFALKHHFVREGDLSPELLALVG